MEENIKIEVLSIIETNRLIENFDYTLNTLEFSLQVWKNILKELNHRKIANRPVEWGSFLQPNKDLIKISWKEIPVIQNGIKKYIASKMEPGFEELPYEWLLQFYGDS